MAIQLRHESSETSIMCTRLVNSYTIHSHYVISLLSVLHLIPFYYALCFVTFYVLSPYVFHSCFIRFIGFIPCIHQQVDELLEPGLSTGALYENPAIPSTEENNQATNNQSRSLILVNPLVYLRWKVPLNAAHPFTFSLSYLAILTSKFPACSPVVPMSMVRTTLTFFFTLHSFQEPCEQDWSLGLFNC